MAKNPTHNKAINDCSIGEASGLIPLMSLEHIQQAIERVASQAKHSIFIFSPDLDKMLFGQPLLVDAITANCRANRNFLVKILIKQNNPRAFEGHHLIELRRRLSSFIQVRELAVDFAELQMEYLIADRIAIVEREPEMPNQGRCDFFSTTRAQRFSREFESMWDLSSTHQEARRLYL